MAYLRIWIVADDPLARAGLSMLLRQEESVDVVAQYSSADLLPEDELQDRETADLILWDLGWEADDTLPEWEGMDLPIVALTADDGSAGRLWAAGATAILPRSAPAGQLLAAMQAAAQGLVVLAPEMMQAGWLAAEDGVETAVSPLTPRELDVLHLLAEGLTNKAIAQRLEISSHTVKFHVNAILSKLNAQSRTEAVVSATRLGLLTL